MTEPVDQSERHHFPLDRDISAAGLYASPDRFFDLLGFVAHHWRVAPYNALLLHIQKPDLTHVETVSDWWSLYRRKPRHTARPLITLQPFSPISLVYDLPDTEGEAVADDEFGPYPDLEVWHDSFMAKRLEALSREGITVGVSADLDDPFGRTTPGRRQSDRKIPRDYLITVPDTGFPDSVRALVHQLAGIHLGHHGLDEARGVRFDMQGWAVARYEAEYITHLVCERSGVRLDRDEGLPVYDGSYEDFDVYRLMKAAGAIERLLQFPFINLERPRYSGDGRR
jgi:hypothetical protein